MAPRTAAEYAHDCARARRRLDRVRQRVDAASRIDPDLILDDFVVLWRAFEATFDDSPESQRSLRSAARVALMATVDHRRGIKAFPDLMACLRSMAVGIRAFRADALKRWFRDERDPDGRGKTAERQAKDLQETLYALEGPLNGAVKWGKEETRSAANVLYTFRNAVFHGRFGSSVDQRPQMIDGLRDAMMEVVEARLEWLSAQGVRASRSPAVRGV